MRRVRRRGRSLDAGVDGIGATVVTSGDESAAAGAMSDVVPSIVRPRRRTTVTARPMLSARVSRLAFLTSASTSSASASPSSPASGSLPSGSSVTLAPLTDGAALSSPTAGCVIARGVGGSTLDWLGLRERNLTS